MFSRLIKAFFLTWAIALLAASAAQAEPADFSALDRLLHHHVAAATVNGIRLNVVDYDGWKNDPDHQAAVDLLAAYDPEWLQTRTERLAFWINAYNLLAVKTVIDTRVEGSIRDAGSLFNPVWDRTAGMVGGKTVTLNQIEHEILRPMGEPRIHLAIVCASLSCPDLRTEAYSPERLSEQLDNQVRLFLANDTKGLAVRDDQLTVSKIFEWFKKDFEKTGGVLDFIREHTTVPTGARVSDHFDYDWTLNACS